jgi:diguanylate cyclase (GGDEF)-like protein
MKLKKYLYKKNIIISITAAILYSVLLIILSWSILSYIEDMRIENKKILFKEFIRMKLAKGSIVLRNIRNNREINIYLKDRLMLESVPYKKKFDDKWYYRYSNNSINRYRISTIIKNAVEENEDISIDIYKYTGEPEIISSEVPINMELLKNIDDIHDFGEISYVYIDKKSAFIQFYGMNESKEYILIMNMKITSNFVYELDKIGIKIIIVEEETGKTVISSYFGSEKIENINLKKSEKVVEINEEKYRIFNPENISWNLKKGYKLYIAEKSNIDKMIIFGISGVIFIIITIFINTMLILRTGTKETLNIISEVNKKIRGDELEKKYYEIEEYNELLEEIEKYKKTKEENEKIAESELNTKSINITALYNRIKIQNNFLKTITIHEKIEEIIYAGFKFLNEIAKIKELKFATVLKGESEVKIINLYEDRKIEQGYEKINGMEEFLLEGKNIKVENENDGVICMMFKTENISAGVLSVYYETKELEQEDRVMLNELTEILMMSLKSAKFYEMSTKDLLTGIYNRGIMNFYLKKMIEENKRYEDETFSILMIDIDKFKKINDMYGHITGDYILKRVVADIGKYVREVDTLFRYGGEEFIVIMPKIDKKGAFIVAERIRKQIEESSLKLDKLFNKDITITISIGIAQFNKGIHKTIQDIIAEADEKMYIAKNEGRNRCEM